MKPTRRAWFTLLLALAVGTLAATAPPAAHAKPVPKSTPRPKPTAKSASPSSASTLGKPYYDPDERLLVLPYKGDEPSYARGTLKLPPRVYFDFEEEALGLGILNEVVPEHPTWLGWAMAPHTGKGVKTRLTLMFKRPTTVSVTIDTHRHALLLLPGGEFAPEPPRPSGRPQPAKTARPLATPRPLASATETYPSPVSVLATPVPEPSGSPLPMPELSMAPHPVVGAPVATPIPLPPSALPTEPSPLWPPSQPPSAQPTFTPASVPTRPAQLDDASWATLSLNAPFYTYDESYTPGAFATHADLPLALDGRLTVGGGAGWTGLVDARVLGLVTSEASGALRSRQEWALFAVGRHDVNWGAVGVQTGLGYLARYQLAAGSALAPWRVAHGPVVLAGLRLPVIDASGWAVRVEGGLTPKLFSAMPQGAQGLPWLWGYELEVAIDAPVGPFKLGAGYRRSAVSGDGYMELMQGPFVSVHM